MCLDLVCHRMTFFVHNGVRLSSPRRTKDSNILCHVAIIVWLYMCIYNLIYMLPKKETIYSLLSFYPPPLSLFFSRMLLAMECIQEHTVEASYMVGMYDREAKYDRDHKMIIMGRHLNHDHGDDHHDGDDDTFSSGSTSTSFDDSTISKESSSSELIDDASSSSSSSPTHGPLYELSELMDQLPIKRGLSKYYQGKSQSFTSLARVTSLEDLAKKETPYQKKIKACRSYGGGLNNFKSYTQPKATISKKASKGSLSNLSCLSRKTSFISSCRPPLSPVQRSF